jgi:hypothetical protein
LKNKKTGSLPRAPGYVVVGIMVEIVVESITRSIEIMLPQQHRPMAAIWTIGFAVARPGAQDCRKLALPGPVSWSVRLKGLTNRPEEFASFATRC